VVWRGPWSSTTAYVANDAVSNAGSSWVAKRASTNVVPAAGLDWDIIAAVGQVGATGPAGLAGPAGPTGPTGAAGPAGPAGATGATGAQGPIGLVGPQGPQGIQGVSGATGPVGPAGATGPQGAAGAIGITWQGVWSPATFYNVRDAVERNGSSYIAVSANVASDPAVSASWNLVASAGAVGPQGIQGATGAQGLAGPTGATGAQGPQGLTGPQGTQGITGPAGPVGPQGPAGPIGATGATGTQGLAGAAGATGATGAQGPQGPQGTAGPSGATGATGPAGPAGVVSVTNVTAVNGGIAASPQCDGNIGMAFFGATATVKLLAAQAMTVTVTADLGTGAAPASNLTLNICYQGTTGGLSALTDPWFLGNTAGAPLSLPANTAIPFTLTRSFATTGTPQPPPPNSPEALIPPDTYVVGMCGCIAGTDTWLSDVSWLSVTVMQQ
jgi:hypothetical protein